ncbi:phosphoribosyltransferase [Lutibacter sp. B2]|nr:phosphoribosyltransferase [Lutibacter sp. B2]
MGCIMKEKTLQTCYKIDQDLHVHIKIKENPYNVPLDELFSMAKRYNKKRSFLFVSKVLGKHIPVNPRTVIDTSEMLAREYRKTIHGKKKTLFIGFAETATALGHAMFDCFENASYIHTTREEMIDKESFISFEEEHSHATAHRCYPIDESIFKNSETIVLVDDEITTGKTALNIIRSIQKKYPKKEYAVVSILDWRKKEDIKRYEELQNELDIKIHTVSIISGEITVEGTPSKKKEIKMKENSQKIDINMHYLDEEFEKVHFASVNNLNEINSIPYIKETARFGLSSMEVKEIHEKCKCAGEKLGKLRNGKHTLCLGNGEFMYIPLKIASHMGDGVVYHSTTRSPIHPFDQGNYAIKNAFSYPNPEDATIMNYFYNIPYGYYDELFIFIEREIERARLDAMIFELKKVGCKTVHFIFASKDVNKKENFGSYSHKDVTFLVKDLNEAMEELGTEERERAIQSGTHYSEMLPLEYNPTLEYINLFHETLKTTAEKIAKSVSVVGEKIIKNRGKDIVLVSLARAGTPIGILIKRYIEYKYKENIPHYSISIIRGKGIDENAIKHILENHPNKEIQFIDGWTGKGAITRVLTDACNELKEREGIYVNDDLAVLADPGHCVSTFGTREDFLIPSACLNSTVSGLVSRTVLREDLIHEDDFHGAKYYRELRDEDVSNLYIDTVTSKFSPIVEEVIEEDTNPSWAGLEDIKTMQEEFEIEDINLIKPGIGETTRVLLRRIPWKILVREDNKNLEHIYLLAKDKNVPIEIYPNMTYLCCGLIKPLKGNKE